jgi:hypothetical protein
MSLGWGKLCAHRKIPIYIILVSVQRYDQLKESKPINSSQYIFLGPFSSPPNAYKNRPVRPSAYL